MISDKIRSLMSVIDGHQHQWVEGHANQELVDEYVEESGMSSSEETAFRALAKLVADSDQQLTDTGEEFTSEENENVDVVYVWADGTRLLVGGAEEAVVEVRP